MTIPAWDEMPERGWLVHGRIGYTRIRPGTVERARVARFGATAGISLLGALYDSVLGDAKLYQAARRAVVLVVRALQSGLDQVLGDEEQTRIE